MKGLTRYRLYFDQQRNDWVLKRDGAKNATKRFSTQAKALGALQRGYLFSSGLVTIERGDGSIEREWTVRIRSG
jgi:hypothetical protein